MDFATGMIDAYKKKWSYINSFSVQFHNMKSKLTQGTSWNDFNDDSLNLNIVSIDTPQFTNQPIEVFVANKWVIHNGRDELYRFSITFRDEDQLKLYRAWLKMYHNTKEQYFDSIKFTVKIFKEADYIGEETEKLLLEMDNTIIESISQVQFSNNTENQIAEFTVNFKTTNTIVKQ